MNHIEREVARRAHEREWVKQYVHLLDEQTADDTDGMKPEFRKQTPLTGDIENRIGMEINGEIVSYEPRPPRGSVLIGTAPWHGSTTGYRNHRCRCAPCRAAQRSALAEYRARRRNGGS